MKNDQKLNKVSLYSIDEKLFVKEESNTEEMDKYFRHPDFFLHSCDSEASDGSWSNRCTADINDNRTYSERKKKSINAEVDNKYHSIATSQKYDLSADSSLNNMEVVTPSCDKDEIIYTISDTFGHTFLPVWKHPTKRLPDSWNLLIILMRRVSTKMKRINLKISSNHSIEILPIKKSLTLIMIGQVKI